jgi:hypothetical protein
MKPAPLLCFLLYYPRNNLCGAFSDCYGGIAAPDTVSPATLQDRRRPRYRGRYSVKCHKPPVIFANAYRKTPVTKARRQGVLPRTLLCKRTKPPAGLGAGTAEKPAGVCYTTPVTNAPVCYTTPVTNRAICYTTPVTTAAQVVDYQRFNFLEIILKRLLESRPADSPAGAGGPCRHNRAYKGRGEKKARTFQDIAAGTVRPAGFWIL